MQRPHGICIDNRKQFIDLKFQITMPSKILGIITTNCLHWTLDQWNGSRMKVTPKWNYVTCTSCNSTFCLFTCFSVKTIVKNWFHVQNETKFQVHFFSARAHFVQSLISSLERAVTFATHFFLQSFTTKLSIQSVSFELNYFVWLFEWQYQNNLQVSLTNEQVYQYEIVALNLCHSNFRYKRMSHKNFSMVKLYQYLLLLYLFKCELVCFSAICRLVASLSSNLTVEHSDAE